MANIRNEIDTRCAGIRAACGSIVPPKPSTPEQIADGALMRKISLSIRLR